MKTNPLIPLAVVGMIVPVVASIVIDSQTPRVTSVLMTDVSDSNSKHKTDVEKVCKVRTELLKEGDKSIDIKFADQNYTTQNKTFEERDRLTRQEQCKQAITRPPGVGDKPGTPLTPVLKSAVEEATKQGLNGNKNSAIYILVIQDDEPLKNEKAETLTEFKTLVEKITKGGDIVIFIGADVSLQYKLKSALSNIGNSQICTYGDAQNCLEWAFDSARK